MKPTQGCTGKGLPCANLSLQKIFCDPPGTQDDGSKEVLGGPLLTSLPTLGGWCAAVSCHLQHPDNVCVFLFQALITERQAVKLQSIVSLSATGTAGLALQSPSPLGFGIILDV